MRPVRPHCKHADLPAPVSTQCGVHCKRTAPTTSPTDPTALAAAADASNGGGRGVRAWRPVVPTRANRRHSCASLTARLSHGRAANRSTPAALTSSGTGQRATAAAARLAEETPKSHRRQHHPLGTLARWCSRFSCRGMPTSSAGQVVLAKEVHLPVPRAVRAHLRHCTPQLTGRVAGLLATVSGTGPNTGVSKWTPGGGPSSITLRGTAGRLGTARLACNIFRGCRLLAFLRLTMAEPAA